MNYRNLTPSMSVLLAFEAAARHESYTRAAQELHLSQSAVSRQVQTLEQLLGVSLFRRVGRRVMLTDVGRRYHVEVHEALGRIRSASLQAMSHQAAGSLRVATLPTFGSTWLLPRLHDFYQQHPDVTLHIHSRIGKLDFDVEPLDAAITVGMEPWPGVESVLIAKEVLQAVYCPQSTLSESIVPAWAHEQTLLTVASHSQSWSSWFSHYQLDHRRMRLGPSFELTSHLLQAVRARIGLGLVPLMLVQNELSRGELVALGEPIDSGRAYYLAYPKHNASLPALQVFRTWLLQNK